MSKHHLPTPILFFKIILRTSLEDGKLKIPKNFIKKYGGDMSNPMFLKPPDGTEWEVFWTKDDGDIWLQKGWKEFATYYSLGHGHMVLFEYKKTCHFEVHIFDKSTLEIKYPFHGSEDAQDNVDQISDDDSVKILDELPPCNKIRKKSPMSCPQPHKKSRTDTSGDVERRSTVQNLPQHIQIEEDMGDTTEQDNLDQISDESVKILDELPSYDKTRQKSAMSCPQPSKKLRTGTSRDVESGKATNGALKEANKFASAKPFFTVKIKPNHPVGNRPNVALAFVKEYFNNKTQIVNFQIGKKLWPVKLLCYPHNSAMFSCGWFQFARENKLLGGDVCVFELINREDAVIDVHIFRRHR